MVEDGAFSHKIDFVTVFLGDSKSQRELQLQYDTGSRVTAILLKGWILPIGGASTVEGLQRGLPV